MDHLSNLQPMDMLVAQARDSQLSSCSIVVHGVSRIKYLVSQHST